MIIDAHAHVIPAAFPDADGWPSWEMPADGPARLVTRRARVAAGPVFFDAAARLEAMSVGGLDAEVISPLPQLIDYQIPGPLFADQCRHINEFMAACCAVGSGRLYGLGVVPLQDIDLAIAELQHIRQLRLHGAEVGATIGTSLIGNAAYLPFFEAVEQLGMPVLVHPLPSETYGLPSATATSYGMPAQAGLGAASIIGGPVAQSLPALRLAFSHGGGGLPAALPRAHFLWGGSRHTEPSVRPADDAPSPVEMARRFYFDTLVFDWRVLRYLTDIVGPGQLIVGSDYPATPREEPAARTLEFLGLTSAQVQEITWDNTFRFLGVQPGRGSLA